LLVFMPSSKAVFISDIEGEVAHVLINTLYKNKNKKPLGSTLMIIKLDLYKTLLDNLQLMTL